MSEEFIARSGIPYIPLRGQTFFPGTIVGFDVGRDRSLAAIDCAMNSDKYLVVSAQRDITVNEPQMEDCYVTDMRRPLVLIFDTPSFIKDQFSGDPAVQDILWDSHLKLRREVAMLFPGQLSLCFDSEILNHRLIQLIIQNNPVDPEQSGPRKLGPKICVPFGKTLRGVLVPNCVTKDLNTEKLYDIDMESFTIKEFPHYAPSQGVPSAGGGAGNEK